MDLNIELKFLKLYNHFLAYEKANIEDILYKKYRRNQKSLDKVLGYLLNNDIEINDIHIQEVLNRFLEYLGRLSEEDGKILQSNSEIVALKLTKLKIEVLYDIKENVTELDESRKQAKLNKVESKYLNKEQVCKVYAIEPRTLDELTKSGEVKTTQLKEKGKHYYSVDFMDKFMIEFSNQ
jgi:hypothetical protein